MGTPTRNPSSSRTVSRMALISKRMGVMVPVLAVFEFNAPTSTVLSVPETTTRSGQQRHTQRGNGGLQLGRGSGKNLRHRAGSCPLLDITSDDLAGLHDGGCKASGLGHGGSKRREGEGSDDGKGGEEAHCDGLEGGRVSSR